MSRFRVEDQFATPAILTPDMDMEEYMLNIKQSVDRAIALNKLVTGQLDADSFLDLLDSHDLDVFQLLDDWDSGIMY